MKRITTLLFFIAVFNSADAQAYKTSNPNSIKIVTTDITNFWDTYDRLSKAETLNDTIATIQKYYFNKAS